MDQRTGEFDMRQPSSARTICVKSLGNDCGCPGCRAEAASREAEETRRRQGRSPDTTGKEPARGADTDEAA